MKSQSEFCWSLRDQTILTKNAIYVLSSQSDFFWSLRDLIKLVTIMSKSMSQSEFCWSLRDP